MKRAAVIAFVVLSTLLVVSGLWVFRGAVLLFALSIVLGAALRPLVDRLVAEGWSLKLAIAGVYLACVGAALAIVFVLGAELVVEIPRAAQSLAGYYEVSHRAPRTGFGALVFDRMPPPEQLYAAVGKLDASEVARVVLDSSLGMLGLLGNLLIVIALAIYWSADRDAFERLWLSLLPVERRTRARTVWTAARVAGGAIVRQEIGQSAVAAVVLGFGFWALGASYWGLAAVAVAVVRLIPLLGIPAAVVAAGALGLTTSPLVAGLSALLVGVLLIGLRVGRGRLFDAPRLNPILAVLTVLGLARAYDLPGLLAAPLVAALIQAVFGELVDGHQTDSPAPTLAELRERTAQLDNAALVLPLSPELGSMVERLKRLLDRADAV